MPLPYAGPTPEEIRAAVDELINDFKTDDRGIFIKEVAGGYALKQNQISFNLGAYDHSRELTIDPVFSYGSYLGGTGAEQGWTVTSGPDGSIYVAGDTASTDFPTQKLQPRPRPAQYHEAPLAGFPRWR